MRRFIFAQTLRLASTSNVEDTTMIKAVIFDLDGTVASFNIDYKSVRADVRSFLMKQGLPPSLLSPNESMFEMLNKAEIFLKNNGKPEKAFANIRAKASEIAEKYELEAARTTSLLPGVLDTLKTLKKMGLRMGLCTVNSQRSAEYVLKRFKISEFFDTVKPRDSVKYVKPNVEHLEAVLNDLKVNPEEGVVVGDGVGDMKCARELKVVAVGLLAGVSAPKQLMDAGANYLITSITDLPSIIQHLNASS